MFKGESMEDYTQIKYDDLIDGVVFKYKRMTPVEVIGLATRNISFSSLTFEGTDIDSMVQLCLGKILWSKDEGKSWTALIDAEGNSKLPELDSHPQLGLDLFYRFRKDVLTPVFTESKTFQNSMSHSEKETASDK